MLYTLSIFFPPAPVTANIIVCQQQTLDVNFADNCFSQIDKQESYRCPFYSQELKSNLQALLLSVKGSGSEFRSNVSPGVYPP